MSRRKMMKKTQYHELDRTYNREAQWPGEWREKLDVQDKLILELGCGKAEFSLGLAARHPEQQLIGIDLKADRMWVAARQAEDMGLSNVAFLCINLLEIDQYFAAGEVDDIWITFPDPYPKKKQVKHRMMNEVFLAKYRHILKPDGVMHYKTDNLELFQYSLEVFVAHPNIRLEALTFNLHEAEDFSPDTKILTTYEKKFMEMGKTINYVRFRFED